MTSDDKVYSTGRGFYGSTGQNTTSNILAPKEITSLNGKKVLILECLKFNVFLHTTEKETYTWGSNGYGMIFFNIKFN